MTQIAPQLIDPLDDTGATLPDGTYVFDVSDGIVQGLTPAPSTPTTRLVPLTTSVDGDPGIVFDSDDTIIWTEIPL